MAIYSVEGKLGTGKTKFVVWRAQAAFREGRRIASNVDLFTEKLTPEKPRPYLRIPDKPTSLDLDAIGNGNPDSYNEDRNGILILDELGTWLNSRTFSDKDRLPVIDWLIHARKKGWDVYLIVQDANMIDRQVREALIEYQCRCIRLDKIRIPLLGKMLPGKLGFLPRMHVVTSRVGYGANAVVAERWFYQGDDLHAAYDTRQIFSPFYPHGAHSVLPPWDYVYTVPKFIRALRVATSMLRGILGAWRDRGKPMRVRVSPAKLPAKDRFVEQVMRLPADRRIRFMRKVGMHDVA